MRSIGVVVAVLLVAACGPAASPAAPTNAPSTPAATAAPASPEATSSPTTTTAIHLVILGDSIATGGEGSNSTSYGVPYAKGIEALTGQAVELQILADPSETSLSLADKVRNRTTMREKLASADIVVITVGGNDGDPFATYPKGTCTAGKPAADCLAAYAPDLDANLDAILTEIESLRAGKQTLIRLTSPDYNALIGLKPSPDLPAFPADLGLTFYRQVAEAETAAACAVAKRHSAACVDFLHAFNGADGTKDAASYLADDHLHPSMAGRDLIAKLLLDLGLAPG